jgi:Ankyrin repeats (many copies)
MIMHNMVLQKYHGIQTPSMVNSPPRTTRPRRGSLSSTTAPIRVKKSSPMGRVSSLVSLQQLRAEAAVGQTPECPRHKPLTDKKPLTRNGKSMTFPGDITSLKYMSSRRSCAALAEMQDSLGSKTRGSSPKRSLSSQALRGIKKVLSEGSSKLSDAESNSTFFNMIKFNPSNPEERVQFGEMEREVKRYIRRNPEALKAKYDFPVGRGALTVSRYPLSALVALGSSLSLVKLAIKANPSALTSSQDMSSTVLHTACSFATDMEVVKYIYSKHPSAIEETTKLVFLPLHNACAREKPSLEMIRFLVEAYPEALLAINKLGDTPLRCAARNKTVSPEVLQYLEEETKRIASLEENMDTWNHISERMSWGAEKGMRRNVLGDVAMSSILVYKGGSSPSLVDSSASDLSDPVSDTE